MTLSGAALRTLSFAALMGCSVEVPPSLMDASIDVGAPDAADGADAPSDLGSPDATPDATDASDGDAGPASTRNVLLIISDDQGLDSSAQYAVGDDLPNTPTIDALAANGITFDNAWATPACTTTRGTLITGLYGVHSGVDHVPALLERSVPTLHGHLGEHRPDLATAIIGKWHLGGRDPDPMGPTNAGVGYYAGTLAGVLTDYESWPLTTAEGTTNETTYHTTAMTDLAIAWVDAQTSPWFLWLAYVAPHTPFHLPPNTLHERDLSGTPDDISTNRRAYYLAAIEAMDHEIGRLLDSLGEEERRNTLVVYLGDNGTPQLAVDEAVFASDHSKNSLYEGGVRVPFVVSGASVERRGVREDALVHTADVWPTLSEFFGAPEADELDGISFLSVLGDEAPSPRATNYTEFIGPGATGWAVRDARYKLLHFDDGVEELYDLDADLGERRNLISDPELTDVATRLRDVGVAIRE